MSSRYQNKPFQYSFRHKTKLLGKNRKKPMLSEHPADCRMMSISFQHATSREYRRTNVISVPSKHFEVYFGRNQYHPTSEHATLCENRKLVMWVVTTGMYIGKQFYVDYYTSRKTIIAALVTLLQYAR